MIEQIKSSEIKKFIEKNPKSVLLDVRTEAEWKTIGKPISDDLGIKTYFITIGQDPSFIESVKKEINKEALNELKKINWTGNIRELRNVIERLIILTEKEITATDVKKYGN